MGRYDPDYVKDDRLKAEAMAKEYGWKWLCFQANIGMLSFIKNIDGGRARINIYLSRMTVATSLNHPKSGPTQLYRRNVSMKQLKKIFENPRQHTGKGYYELLRATMEE